MSGNAPHTEQQQLVLIAKGDPVTFSAIFKEYYAALCHYAAKITGEPHHSDDLVQEVFEKLWHKQTNFETIYHLKSFLYKATRNTALNFMKGSIHAKERQQVFLKGQESLETYNELQVIYTEVFRVLYKEISQLPEQSGKIVRMSYIDGLKNEAIAQQLGLSLQTVKNQKSRGIALLRTRIDPSILSFLILLLRQA